MPLLTNWTAASDVPETIPAIEPSVRFGVRIEGRFAGEASRGVAFGVDTVTDRTVVLKHVGLGDPLGADGLHRLEQEYAVLQSVQDPILRSTLGMRRARRGGRVLEAALLLEFVPGDDLGGRGSDDPAGTLSAMLQVCHGLGRLHRRGLVHGDVRPDHVLVAPDGTPTLVGLGHATRAGRPLVPIVVGDPFEAPERVDGGLADPRTDVYGVACTLAAVLGSDAIPTWTTGESLEDRCLRHASVESDLLQVGVPAEAARLLAEAMHPDPQRRHGGLDAIASGIAAIHPAGVGDRRGPSGVRNPSGRIRNKQASGLSPRIT